jgi:monoamine oxidase
MGPQGIISLARDGLSAAFGSTATKGILATAVMGWGRSLWIGGAYSYAKVGAGKCRKAMIAANSGAVRFAGEAFSLGWYSTVNGAWQFGRDVATDL